MDDAVLLEISFPFVRNVFTTVVGTKNNKFSSGSAFNSLVPGLEGDADFAFSAKKVDPGVAP